VRELAAVQVGTSEGSDGDHGAEEQHKMRWRRGGVAVKLTVELAAAKDAMCVWCVCQIKLGVVCFEDEQSGGSFVGSWWCWGRARPEIRSDR
jgi:hypothetical protein